MNSSGTDEISTDRTTTSAPKVPRVYAKTSPGRRPPVRIRRVAGIAITAPPTTAQLPAIPAAHGPAMEEASSAPTATPLATPRPPTIWVPTSRPRVRRCREVTSTTVELRSKQGDYRVGGGLGVLPIGADQHGGARGRAQPHHREHAAGVRGFFTEDHLDGTAESRRHPHQRTGWPGVQILGQHHRALRACGHRGPPRPPR